jgi:hypothetical protein
MKYAIIIDSYPQTDIQKERLIKTLKKLKGKNIDVLLTSHNTCTPEIIENSTYFLFEKQNNYYYLDSHILNENIKESKEPTYMRYTYINDNVFYDKLVVTAWSVAITSQLFNSINFLYGKGYDYAFYMVDDFVCPNDFEIKLNEILEKSKNKRNYFIKNQAMFSSWFAGFFFGFTIDKTLIDRIPNLDFSDNKTYQKYFPNCSGEDVVNEIWKQDDNLIEEHDELNNIFGIGNWNMDSSVIKPGPSTLHNDISSSIYVNSNDYCLMLFVNNNSLFNKVNFNIKLYDESNTLLYSKQTELQKGWYFLDYLNDIFEQNKKVIFEKEIIGYSENITYFKDAIIIDRDTLESYKRLKNYNKI